MKCQPVSYSGCRAGRATLRFWGRESLRLQRRQSFFSLETTESSFLVVV